MIIWYIQAFTIPIGAAVILNGAGHKIGYRLWKTKDNSRNIIPVGLLLAGEELHNNHHAFPRSAKFSCKTWEFDITWLYIFVMYKIGLVSTVNLQKKHLDLKR